MDSGRGERCFSSKHYILKCNQSKENSSKKCLLFCRNLVNCIRYKFSEFSTDGSLKIKANTLREICLLGAYLVFLSQTVADCSPLHSKTLDICEIYYKLTNSQNSQQNTCNGIVGLKLETSLKKRPRHKCFPLNEQLFQNIFLAERYWASSSEQEVVLIASDGISLDIVSFCNIS